MPNMHKLLKAWHFMVLYQSIACYSLFTIGDTELPRNAAGGAIGYDNKTNSILLFGGDDNEQQFIRFQNNQFIDEGQAYLSSSQQIAFTGQQYTQINNMLWTTDEYGDYLYAINTHTYSADEPSITIPTSPYYRGCLASYMHYIFVVGGGDTTTLDLVQIYDTLDAIWITNTPNMNQARRSFSCLVSGSQLFAIGGWDGSNYLDSIEALTVSDINNINSHKWNYLSGTLSKPLADSRAVSYGDNIIVIGGWDGHAASNTVHIIDTITGSCTLWDTLLTARDIAPSIVVQNTLFVFSGWIDDTPNTKTYEYKLLPTTQPTKSPTPNPTPTTTAPSPTPTTTAPSPAPTVHPSTASPTQPGPLPCGGETVGVYSSGQLVFETSIPFTGDIIFDASNSNFGIAEIQALTALGTSLGYDSDGDDVVTLSQATSGEYKFVMVGEEEGIYHVKIQCESDSPTKSPSYAPITAHPTSSMSSSYLTTFAADNSSSAVSSDMLPLYLIMIGSLIVVMSCIVCLCIILCRMYQVPNNIAVMADRSKPNVIIGNDLQQGVKVMNNNIIDMDLSDCLDYYNQTTTGSGQVRRPMASLFVAKQGSDVVDEVEGVHNVEMKRTVEGPRGYNVDIPDKKNTENNVTSDFGTTTKGD
eukprot:757522_1